SYVSCRGCARHISDKPFALPQARHIHPGQDRPQSASTNSATKSRRHLMTDTALRAKTAPQQTEHFDVAIVGAGISGVGAAYHLTKQCPGTSFVVLEEQDSFGGTWLTHRYPGTRSDSDLYTFGYRFKPWTSAPIATRAEILDYMGEVIAENGLGPHIRYRHRISSARWSSRAKL